VLTLTGPSGVFGQSQLKGIQLALDEINKEDAVPGLKIQATIRDDTGDKDQGINVFEELFSIGAHAIVGPTLSNTAFSTDPLAQEKGVPVLAISNTASGITDIGDFIFRNSLTEADVVPQTIAAVADKLQPSTAALLFANDEAFSRSSGEIMRSALEEHNIEIVGEFQFSTNDTDFRSQLEAVRDMDPDIIVVSALLTPATQILLQSRELGLNQPIVGGNGFNTPQLLANAGAAAEGIIVGAAWNIASQNELSKRFVEDFRSVYNEDPDQFAAQSYAGVYVLAEALTNANGANAEMLRDELAGIRNFDTVLGSFSFSDNRDAVHDAVVQQTRDGKFVIFN
jgi:branched-chain amino acid transport system substrate-binding protein